MASPRTSEVASEPDPKVPFEGGSGPVATAKEPLLPLRGSGSDDPPEPVTQGESVDLGDLAGVKTVDWLIIVFFLAFFVLGFAQGTIRRLIGIGAVLFSFLFAANVAEPLGTFLGNNWTHLPKEYAYMVGFGTIFVAAALAFAIVVQGFYKTQPLFQRARFVDEVLGGLLGLLQAGIILLAVVVILDSFFRLNVSQDPDEIGFLRDLWNALNSSEIVRIFRESVIPAFFALIGLFIPDKLKANY
jgi:membrane protein required for colicin V production